MTPTVRKGVWLVLACWLLGACGGTTKQAEPQFAATEWREDAPPAESPKPVTQRPQLTSGEHLTWRFSLFGIELGRLALAVGQPGTVENREVVVVRALVETTNVAAVFAPVQETLTTFVATDTLEPVYQRREVEKGTEYEWVEVKKMAQAGFHVDYRERSEDKDSAGDQKLSEGVPLFDSNSLFLAARTWDTKQGDRMVVNIFREIYVWKLQIEHTGSETIKTPLGEFPAIRYDCIGRRLTREDGFDTDMEPRKYSFWVSDDNKRLPLAVLAKTDYGNARMELVEHGVTPTP